MFLCPWCDEKYSEEIIKREYNFADGVHRRCPKGHVLLDKVTGLPTRERSRLFLFIYGFVLGIVFSWGVRFIPSGLIDVFRPTSRIALGIEFAGAVATIAFLAAFGFWAIKKGQKSISKGGASETLGQQRVVFGKGVLAWLALGFVGALVKNVGITDEIRTTGGPWRIAVRMLSLGAFSAFKAHGTETRQLDAR